MHAITILGVVAAFGLLLLSLLALCAERGFRPDLKAVAAFRGLSPVRRFLLIAVLGLLTLSAGTKDGGGTAGAPSARMSAPRRVLAVPPGLTVSETETNLGYRVLAVRDGGGISPPSSGAVTNEAWLRRGGRSDAFRIGMEPDPAGEDWLPDPDSAWAFPYCGSWSYGLTVFAHGEFQPGARTDFFPPPYQEYELVSTNAGALASTHLGDIEVTVALTDASTQEAAQVHASASSVRLEMEAVFAAPENAACRRRHVYGVGEKVKFRTFPQSPEIMFTTRRLDTGMNDVTGLWDYELFDGAEQIDASSVREYICPISANYHPPVKVVLGDVEYEPLISLVEPQNVVTTGASWGENNVDFFYEGNRRCWPSGAVGSACLVTTNYIGPMNVSFQGIAVSEVPCVEEDVITGCFTSASGRTHTKQAGAGKAYCIAEGNFWFVDGARADNYVHNWIPNTSSVLTWKIPIGWHRRSKTQDDWFGVEEEEFESYDDKSSRPLFCLAAQTDISRNIILMKPEYSQL